MESASQRPTAVIMIVEDDAELRATLAEILTRAGLQVELAVDGADAITRLDEIECPCAILVDLMMPGIVGQELLEYLDSDDRFGATAVAIVTGSPELAPEGYPVFEKPVDLQALVKFVLASCRTGEPAERSGDV